MPFKKGQSGNPGGRPKGAPEFRERARKAVDEHVLEAWIDEVELRLRQVGGTKKKRKARGRDWVKASELLASYGYGKPTQPITGVGADGEPEPVDITIRFVKPEVKS